MSKVEQIGKVYRVTQDDEQELILFDTVMTPPASQPAPQRQTAPRPEPEHEEKTETKPTKNPFSKKSWNLTEQAKLKKNNPKEYERLRAAAME